MKDIFPDYVLDLVRFDAEGWNALFYCHSGKAIRCQTGDFFGRYVPCAYETFGEYPMKFVR